MSDDRLQLVWPHKDEFLLVPRDEDGKPVWVSPDHPAAREVRLTREVSAVGEFTTSDPHLDNTIFVGDSFDAMRVMCEVPEFAARFAGKVKLIYADPPFNTGQTFQHYDDWMEHATWLSWMRDRLMQMKELLSDTGSVWIHLDDAEVHRMRCLLDEVFGANNFVAMVIWEKTTSARNDAKLFSTDQDYVLVYAKNAQLFRLKKDPHTAAADSAYKNPDNDPRGPWREVDYKGPKSADERPNLYYPLTHPKTGEDVFPRRERVWAYGKEEYARHVSENLLWWGKTQNYTF